MTGWLTYMILAVMIFSVVWGWKNGFIRMLIAMLSWILVIFLAIWLNPYIGKFLKKNITFESSLAERCAAFLLAVLLAVLLVKILGHMLNLLAWLPGLGFFNHLAGALFGLARSIIWLWLFFIVVTVFVNTGWGETCMQQINSSSVLQYFYNHNYLMKAILRM